MSSSRPPDYFDKARLVAATFLFTAGVIAVLGALLDWVTISPPDVVPADQATKLAPFTGIEATDGWIVIVGGVLIIGSAALLVMRGTSGYAWIAFFASMVVGAVGVADFRGINQLFYEEMDRIGKPEPGVGLILVAAAGIVGLIAAAAGAAASPRRGN
jgi:hypothetical protein